MCEECASLVIDRHLEGADETAPALIQKSGHMIPYSVTNPLIGNRGSVIRLDDVRVIVARWHESGWEFSAGIGGRDSENLEIQATRTTSNNPMPLIASGWKFPTPNYGWITVAIEKNRR
jgi:hypothetical protein